MKCSAERGKGMAFCPVCRCEYEDGAERCLDCNSVLVESLPPEDEGVEPDASLVEVHQAAGDEEALIIKALLESEGIWCSLSSDVPHSVIPLTVDGLGAVRILVSEDDSIRAEEIISSRKTEADQE